MNHFAVHLKLTQHCKSTIFHYQIKIKKKKKKGTGQSCRDENWPQCNAGAQRSVFPTRLSLHGHPAPWSGGP